MQPVENVSNYPRPPLIELVSGSVEIWIAGQAIAQDQRYVRVCETFHPPSIYLHPSAFRLGTLHPSTGRPSFCEWKGVASYWDVSADPGRLPVLQSRPRQTRTPAQSGVAGDSSKHFQQDAWPSPCRADSA